MTGMWLGPFGWLLLIPVGAVAVLTAGAFAVVTLAAIRDLFAPGPRRHG